MVEEVLLLELWRQYAGGRVLEVYILAAWVHPISRDEFAWVGVYDITDDRSVLV